MKALPKNVRKKLKSTPSITNAAVMQETETKFGGCNTYILVPVSSGIEPKEIAAEFTKQILNLRSLASRPTLRDLAIISANAIPNLIQRALESEN